MKNRIYLLYVALTLALSVVVMGCPNEAPKQTDQEVITTVKITLVDQETKESKVVTWEDKDGGGSANPTISPSPFTIGLGKTYVGTIEMFNILATTEAGKNVTTEIEDEKNSHQFFFNSLTADDKDATGVTITKEDVDDNGLPIGLSFELKTEAASDIAKLRVRLVHYGELKKGKDLPASADLDVDIDITFSIATN